MASISRFMNIITCPEHSYFCVGNGVYYYAGVMCESKLWQCKYCGKIDNLLTVKEEIKPNNKE